MRILVVGGAGYIGTHMVQALLEAGHQPVVLDDLTKGHRELVPGGEFVRGSCGDRALLDRIFAGNPIDAVMHFAAYSLVGESVQRPIDYWANNVGSTATLLQAMLAHGVKRFVFSSTAAVYGEPERIPIDENAAVRPTNPYGASKAAVERMLEEAHAANGLAYVVLRYFNASGAHPDGHIGERHRPETHLIPLVLEVATGRRPHISVFGTDYPTKDGTCLRDYVHVCDLAQAHLLALDALAKGRTQGVFNLGSSRGYTVREVIETARKVTGHAIPVVEGARRPGDPAVLVATSDRARDELGWCSRFEALETIVETAWKWAQRESRASG